LQELRKARVEWYSPTHPIAQQFAQQRGLSAEQLANPTPALRGQLARAWGAEFVMTVRCTRAPEQNSFEYSIKVWRLGARAPVWEAEGFQQVASRQGKSDDITALQTLGRTVALRLDAELWDTLPRLAEQLQTPTPSPPRAESPAPAEPRPLAEQLLREGKYAEALPHLRAAVNAQPDDAELRMALIRLYRRLSLGELAQRELTRAVQLYPNDERFALEWAALLQAEGKPAEAISRLQTALQAQPDSVALRLALFDALLMQGDAPPPRARCSRLPSRTARRSPTDATCCWARPARWRTCPTAAMNSPTRAPRCGCRSPAGCLPTSRASCWTCVASPATPARTGARCARAGSKPYCTRCASGSGSNAPSRPTPRAARLPTHASPARCLPKPRNKWHDTCCRATRRRKRAPAYCASKPCASWKPHGTRFRNLRHDRLDFALGSGWDSPCWEAC
jgi:tetratricopeptide (TPR) repeat protein